MKETMMLRTAFVLLTVQRFRFVVTVVGVALCVLLMGFLVGIYRGVSEGSLAYVRAAHADVWVLQSGTTNILRGFSILTNAHGSLIRETEGVQEAAPVLFRLSTMTTPAGVASTYIAGFDPESNIGGPPHIVEGRSVERTGEVVLDQAFARRWTCRTGDVVEVLGLPLRVVGVSDGSNMFVIQYAFAHLDDVRHFYGVSDIVSAFLVRLRDGSDPTSVATLLQEEVPGVSVYDNGVFLENNIAEMEHGFLPVILVIMVFGSALLTVIVGLLLTMNVLEHRKTLAVFKAIGAPGSYLPALVLLQSLELIVSASLLAGVLSAPVVACVTAIVPEVSVHVAPNDVMLLLGVLVLLLAVGALFPLRKLTGIYPAEAFQ